MATKPKRRRAVKAWSTRNEIAEELDAVAEELEQYWSYTLDRSKLLNCFCSMLFKAHRNARKINVNVINEESLEEAIYQMIRKNRG